MGWLPGSQGQRLDLHPGAPSPAGAAADASPLFHLLQGCEAVCPSLQQHGAVFLIILHQM